ncbi:MAG: class B sortase [Oscillospiraceae bacterium]|jgi:sortase B|nr:class B sortase [Oscillospiraceae bacterium]
MDDNNFWQPESEDVLNAVEAVFEPSRRKRNFFESNIIPLRSDTRKERRRKIIFDFLLVVMFCCVLVLLWVLVYDPWQANKKENNLINIMNPPATSAVAPSPGQEPQTAPPTEVRYSFEKLLAINSDCIGWLSAPGAGIDLPVVQTKNNNYYLYRNFYLQRSRYGNPFMDCDNTLSPMSTNLIIYGHNMNNNGKIFANLTRYQKASTVANNPLITLLTPDGGAYYYKIFAVIDINGNPKDDNGYVFQANTREFVSEKSFNGFIAQLKQRSYVNTGVDIKYGDKLLSLQTCLYNFKEEYLYVVGRLVRPGESPTVDASQVVKNPNPRVAQALYDDWGLRNPFKNAARWDNN